MLFSVRDVDVLRLLCWCQNIRPQDLNSISTKAERENLMALGFIKLHERSGTLTLTGSGRALLDLIFNGAIPSLSLSYHGAAIERRIRLRQCFSTHSPTSMTMKGYAQAITSCRDTKSFQR